jgi:hypothetical protein
MHSSPSPSSMDVALRMVREGVLEVRPDGTIWKLRNLNRMPFSVPRRVETRAKNGYLLVKVHADSRQHLVAAHRLAWTVLRGPIPDGMQPNHMDGDKANNSPSNLELVTRSENIRHAYRTGLLVKTNVSAELAREARALRGQGLSFSAIGKRLGVSQTTAFRAVNAK